ncbi:hypothetical protein [Phyllobacterium myrsinacearum]|uniref:Uncharacterized protein n=1 Tax=Phyllobacterium myrsinacearum TaxID=28101 RepID=A0A839ECV6_9HYPH|nr:hypothetical protein [Phyllobacterium myrsinacearum]MBA8876772.1 hypothetical protein [Phyllobacterium myrsinacearum]
MAWYVYVAHFFAGAFLANAVPHLVSGVSGRSFRTPFVRLHGGTVSSATTNIVWGWVNLALAYVLLGGVGPFAFSVLPDILVTAAGGFAMMLLLSRIFAKRS